jgi:preprotein translocase subunit SecG
MFLYNILLIVQIIVAVGIIGLVLIQHGKGADAGAAFGGGASGTVFGSRGAGNFLSRSTAVLAFVFFANSMGLAWLIAHRDDVSAESVVDTMNSANPAIEQVQDAAPSDVPTVPGTEGSTVAPASSQSQNDVPAAAPADIPSAPATEGVQTDAAPADVPKE